MGERLGCVVKAGQGKKKNWEMGAWGQACASQEQRRAGDMPVDFTGG
jgi:hypothetical protein